jgi:murein DD-endopeptidase MepM/ murein hydrolase activator NlpD
MRVPVLTQKAQFLARSVAIIAVASAAAGCSSNAMRFQDGLFTNSTSRQATMQAAAPQPRQQYAQPQPYPGDVDRTYTGSVNRQAVQPVAVASRPRGGHPVPSASIGHQPASLPAPQVAVAPTQPFSTAPAAASGQVTRQQMAAPAATQAARAPAALDQTVTGSTAPRPQTTQPASQKIAEGWSREGGTELTVRQGETVQNLSRRYGVPVDAILRANGMASATALAAGQKIVIPTYSRGGTNVAKADLPADKAPANAPAERLAVLPQTTRIGEKQQGQQPATSAAKSAPTVGSVYTVQAWDTLSAIARRMGTTTTAIKQANGLDGGLIRVGQKLTIPGASAQNVANAKPATTDPIVTGSTGSPAKAADGSSVSGYTPPAKAENVIEDTVKEAAIAPDATGIGRMRWPVRGRVISAFGGQSGGKKNDGIDIAVPEGTPVKAAENGVVIYAGDGLKDFGNTVLVRHEDGLVTVYGHASEIKVSRGETVRRGQEIARSGLSGNADAPKLHFEVRKNSTPVDPGKYLE